MENSKKISTYYKDSIPDLISKYKKAHKQCLEIVGQTIDIEISDDKLHNVLKGKRMAAEDAKHYASQIDLMENELNGVNVKEEEEKENVSWAKRKAKKLS